MKKRMLRFGLPIVVAMLGAAIFAISPIRTDTALAACASGEVAVGSECRKEAFVNGQVGTHSIVTGGIAASTAVVPMNSPAGKAPCSNDLPNVQSMSSSFVNSQYGNGGANGQQAGWVERNGDCVWRYYEKTSNTPDGSQSGAQNTRDLQWAAVLKYCDTASSGMPKQECTDKIKQIFDQCSKVGTAIKNDALSKCMEGKDSKFKAADLKKLLDENAPDDTATSSDKQTVAHKLVQWDG